MFNNNVKTSPSSQRYVPISSLSTHPSHIKEYTCVLKCASVWKAGPMWKILLSEKIPWGALQLMQTTVILLTATDLCWLTPAEDPISYALENWCSFFHSCSRVSILSWGSTPTSRSAGAESALNLKSGNTEGHWDMRHLIFTDPERFLSSMAAGFMYFLL